MRLFEGESGELVLKAKYALSKWRLLDLLLWYTAWSQVAARCPVLVPFSLHQGAVGYEYSIRRCSVHSRGVSVDSSPFHHLQVHGRKERLKNSRYTPLE